MTSGIKAVYEPGPTWLLGELIDRKQHQNRLRFTKAKIRFAVRMLTEAEKTIIQSGWSEGMKDGRGLGVDIFLTLFDMYPPHQDLFRDFKGKSRAELEKLPRLKAHAMRVVNTLDGAIQSLDDMAVCASSLELIGASHTGRNVTVGHFEDLNKVLLVVLERRLGQAFLDNKAVWMKLLQGIIPVIQRGMCPA